MTIEKILEYQQNQKPVIFKYYNNGVRAKIIRIANKRNIVIRLLTNNMLVSTSIDRLEAKGDKINDKRIS
jgi:hypothetical protein